VPRPAGIVSIASFAALICASIRNQLAFLAKTDRACEGKQCCADAKAIAAASFNRGG
jgi:hypothetical protein